ncbi:MAG: hypothetical protein QOD07_2915 [Frankiaceae bacterium]|nr:hypothetical protein [Frankiaceae bacterium]
MQRQLPKLRAVGIVAAMSLAVACSGSSAPHASPSAGYSQRAAAVLGRLGFTVGQQGSLRGGGAGALVSLTRQNGDVARVTLQPDVAALHDQFPRTGTLPDGTPYGIQHAGTGAISCAVYRDGQAVILTIIPATDAAPKLSVSQFLQDAEALLATVAAGASSPAPAEPSHGETAQRPEHGNHDTDEYQRVEERRHHVAEAAPLEVSEALVGIRRRRHDQVDHPAQRQRHEPRHGVVVEHEIVRGAPVLLPDLEHDHDADDRRVEQRDGKQGDDRRDSLLTHQVVPDRLELPTSSL